MSATLGALDIDALQRRGRAGDDSALMELVRRVLDFDLCLLNSGNCYCVHEHGRMTTAFPKLLWMARMQKIHGAIFLHCKL